MLTLNRKEGESIIPTIKDQKVKILLREANNLALRRRCRLLILKMVPGAGIEPARCIRNED